MRSFYLSEIQWEEEVGELFIFDAVTRIALEICHHGHHILIDNFLYVFTVSSSEFFSFEITFILLYSL